MTTTLPLVSHRRICVGFGDCDPARIVYYPNYFEWFDQSTHELFAKAGVPLHEWSERTGILIPLVGVHGDFIAPAAWGDELDIASSVSRWGNSSFDVLHRVAYAAGGGLVAEATETRTCVRCDPQDAKKITPVPVPADIRDTLSNGRHAAL